MLPNSPKHMPLRRKLTTIPNSYLYAFIFLQILVSFDNPLPAQFHAKPW